MAQHLGDKKKTQERSATAQSDAAANHKKVDWPDWLLIPGRSLAHSLSNAILPGLVSGLRSFRNSVGITGPFIDTEMDTVRQESQRRGSIHFEL